MLFLLAKFWCFLQAAGGFGARCSLGAQHPAPFLVLCLHGLEVGLCHQGKLFWIESNVSILVVLEVNFAHKHQNQSNILLTVTWCSASALHCWQDLPQFGPCLHQGSMHGIYTVSTPAVPPFALSNISLAIVPLCTINYLTFDSSEKLDCAPEMACEPPTT